MMHMVVELATAGIGRVIVYTAGDCGIPHACVEEVQESLLERGFASYQGMDSQCLKINVSQVEEVFRLHFSVNWLIVSYRVRQRKCLSGARPTQ